MHAYIWFIQYFCVILIVRLLFDTINKKIMELDVKRLVVKYVRVSTSHQKVERQIIDNVGIDRVYEDIVSGSTPFASRPMGGKLYADILSKRISTVVVHSLDRLGRDTIDILKTIQFMEENGVLISILSLGLNSRLNGKTNPIFKMVSTIVASLAEAEKSNIRERTQEGINAARQRGVVFGRSFGSKETRKDFLGKQSSKDVIKLLNKGNNLTIREIASIANVSPQTVQKVKKVLVGNQIVLDDVIEASKKDIIKELVIDNELVIPEYSNWSFDENNSNT